MLLLKNIPQSNLFRASLKIDVENEVKFLQEKGYASMNLARKLVKTGIATDTNITYEDLLLLHKAL